MKLYCACGGGAELLLIAFVSLLFKSTKLRTVVFSAILPFIV